MPPAESLIGNCTSKPFCTAAAAFHLTLNLLGKTNQTTPEENMLLTPLPSKVPACAPLHNQVFLYDVKQIHDEDEARSYKYRRDLGNFLGLKHELPPIGHNHTSRNHKYDLDICENRYQPLRQALMDVAKPASEWIRTYFIQSPEVYVSSHELLLEWLEDPCDKESDENNQERRHLAF